MINRRLSKVKKEDILEFMSDYALDIDSAYDIWMSDNNKIELFNLLRKGKKIKSISNTVETDTEEDRFNRRIDNWKKKGWKVFDDEQNYDNWETILVK